MKAIWGGQVGQRKGRAKASHPPSPNTMTCVDNAIKNEKLTFSSSLALSLRSKKLFPLTGSNLVVFDLPVAQAADLLEKL
jgi:hypothetical protein